jgi:Cof subfamily protein (haloacid dehalogenase superfamily)
MTPEAEFPIRLLALDIDGTIIDRDLALRERTRAAIREAVDRGVAVSLVTGRMASSARAYADELGLTGPIVAYQGGLIRAMAEPPEPGRRRRVGRLLLHTPLAPDVAREAVAWTRTRGLDPHINHLEHFILRADDPRADDYSAFMGARARLVPDLIEAIRRPVSKILAVGTEADVAAALNAARAQFAGRADVTISNPRFLEFIAPGVSKGRAVRWLARQARVSLTQTMAIGDQLNDLEMIAAVGHGVAMAGAPSSVRAVARYVAPPVEEEGAAQVIERLVLGRPALLARAVPA